MTWSPVSGECRVDRGPWYRDLPSSCPKVTAFLGGAPCEDRVGAAPDSCDGRVCSRASRVRVGQGQLLVPAPSASPSPPLGLPNTLPPTRHPLTELPREPDPGQALPGRPTMAVTAHALAGNLELGAGFPRPTGSRGAPRPPTLSQRPLLPSGASDVRCRPSGVEGTARGRSLCPQVLLPASWSPVQRGGREPRGELGAHLGPRAPLHVNAPHPGGRRSLQNRGVGDLGHWHRRGNFIKTQTHPNIQRLSSLFPSSPLREHLPFSRLATRGTDSGFVCARRLQPHGSA